MQDWELQHPDITSAEATGYPCCCGGKGLRCVRCDGRIWEEEFYLCINDQPYHVDCANDEFGRYHYESE